MQSGHHGKQDKAELLYQEQVRIKADKILNHYELMVQHELNNDLEKMAEESELLFKLAPYPEGAPKEMYSRLVLAHDIMTNYYNFLEFSR